MSATLKIKCHRDGMKIPSKAHESDVGIDITAYEVKQKSADVFMFDMGISIHASEGYYVEIVPRSSISKTDFVMANSVGIIDPDYRGVIFVPFRYVGKDNALEAAQALVNTRIAQMIIRKVEPCSIEVVDSLDDTLRGEGGFGSTGTA